MDDDTLLEAFESCTLAPEALGHREHVRVAWLILRAHPRFEDGAQRFCAGLRRFAEAHGKAGLYHETITWAYLVLVNERMRGCGATRFDELAAANGDLLKPALGALLSLYERNVLRSERARGVFLLPPRGTPHP
jgi:nitroreductase